MLLVTGGNGFIATELVTAMYPDDVNFRLAARERRDNVIGIGDIHGDTDWSSAVTGISTVVHLAGIAHKISTQPEINDFRRVNVDGSLNLARQAARAGVGRFVFVSSIGVLGQTTKPGQAFSDHSPANPVTPYAVSKYEAEIALRALCDELGMELVILRPPLVYGRHAKGNFGRLIDLVARGYPLPFGAVVNRRNLVSVESLAKAIIACAMKPEAARQTFVVADRNPVSTRDVIEAIATGLAMRARLFSFPPPIMYRAFKAIGRSTMADGLFGSLEVDASRIAERLSWQAEEDTGAAIAAQFGPNTDRPRTN